MSRRLPSRRQLSIAQPRESRGVDADSIRPVGFQFDRNALQLDDPALDAIRALLSRHVVQGRVRVTNLFYGPARLIESIVRFEIADVAPLPGFHLAQPMPSPRAFGRLRNRGGEPLSSKAIFRIYEDQNHFDAEPDGGVFPTLPDELLTALYPVCVWPALHALALDRDLLGKRANLAIRALAQAAYDEGRPYKASTIRNWVLGLQRVFRDFIALRSHPSGVFAEWESIPRIESPEAFLDHETGRHGTVARRDIRLRDRLWLIEVRSKLGLPVEANRLHDRDEVARIQELSAHRRKGLFHLLRGWAAWTLLSRNLSRVDAVSHQVWGDWRPGYEQTACGRIDTLLHYPRKGHPDDYCSPKPMGSAGWPIHVFRAFLEAHHGRVEPDWPLLPAGLQLTVAEMGARRSKKARQLGPSGLRPWSAGSIHTWLGGSTRPPTPDETAALRQAAEEEGRSTGWFTIPSERDGSRRVFVYDDGRIGHIKPALPRCGEDPYAGWNPHILRAAGAQALEAPETTLHLLETNSDLPQRYFSEILSDRSTGRAAAELYKLDKGRRERIAGSAIAILDALYATDFGARRGVPVEHYKQLLREHQAFRSQRQRLRDQRATLRDRRRRGRINVDTYDTELDAIIERDMDVALDLRDIEHELTDIEHGRVKVPWPDEDPDQLVATVEDLPAAKAEVLGHAGGVLRHQRIRCRDWLTVKEFANVVGITPKAIGDWLRGSLPPSGIPPWTVGFEPVDAVGERRRRIIVDLVNEAWWEAHPIYRQRADELLCDWPAEANWHKHRDQHATPPEWSRPRVSDSA